MKGNSSCRYERRLQEKMTSEKHATSLQYSRADGERGGGIARDVIQLWHGTDDVILFTSFDSNLEKEKLGVEVVRLLLGITSNINSK